MRFPIGIQNLRDIVTGGYCYVDKTRYVKLMADGSKYYFLSRPRRFGKSLFLDTLRCAFSGERELFSGLFLEENWDWQVRHPVVHISFGGGIVRNQQELIDKIDYCLRDNAVRLGVKLEEKNQSARFAELLARVHAACGMQVVVLVDEYDKPILDCIDNLGHAVEVRDGLRDFYSVIKSSDEHIRLAFLTGVSKFSKVSIFSGLNNLYDLTMDTRFATALGITHEELEKYFNCSIDELTASEGCARDQVLERIRAWYNGYQFSEEPVTVYNPFSLISLFSSGKFKNYWFETGTPAFLLKLIRDRGLDLAGLETEYIDELAFSAYEIENLDPLALMFQTGYLTIRDFRVEEGQGFYRLGFPNNEVEQAFPAYLGASFFQSGAHHAQP